MLDFINKPIRMRNVDREDKALLRSTLSARSMPGDGREHGEDLMLLSSCPSFGLKAKNLLAWGEASSKANITKYGIPVGHMSISSIRGAFF
jgi:hypothetical protein